MGKKGWDGKRRVGTEPETRDGKRGNGKENEDGPQGKSRGEGGFMPRGELTMPGLPACSRLGTAEGRCLDVSGDVLKGSGDRSRDESWASKSELRRWFSMRMELPSPKQCHPYNILSAPAEHGSTDIPSAAELENQLGDMGHERHNQ